MADIWMAKKQATKAEREYMNKVASLGCIICGSPAQVHHKTGAGMGLRASHYDTIPLCHHHHNGAEGIHTIGKMTWEAKYGYQVDMIEETRKMIDEE